MNRRLYRCDHDRKIAGVASGLAEYFDIDVSLVRILWVVSIFFGGFGILLYIVMALVVPLEPAGMQPAPWGPAGMHGTWGPGAAAPGAGAWGAAPQPLWGPGATGAAGTASAANGATNAGEPPAGTTPFDPGTTGTQAAGPGYAAGGFAWQPAHHRHERRGGGMGMTFFGVVLILFGALALVDQVLPAWADQGRFLWPAFILGLGVLLVVAAMRRQERQP